MVKKKNQWLVSILVFLILLSCLTLNVCAVDATKLTEHELSRKSLRLDGVMGTSEEYAQYYGGSYLDSGELVVLLTDTSSEITSFVEETIKMKPRYQKCNVSLRELKTTRQEIEDILTNYSPGINRKKNELVKSISVMGTYIDKNVIFVGIIGCDDKKISQFKRYISDAEYIIFRNSEGIIDHSTSEQVVEPDASVLDADIVVVALIVMLVGGVFVFFLISKKRRKSKKHAELTDEENQILQDMLKGTEK